MTGVTAFPPGSPYIELQRWPMVSQCANQACNAEFKMLHSGDLYALERRSVDTEFFWLCSACIPSFVLGLNSGGFVSLTRRSSDRPGRQGDPEGRLWLVYSPLEPVPWLRAGLARGLKSPPRRGCDLLLSSTERLRSLAV